MNAGWWRRNRWGLLLLVPALIAALAGPFYQSVLPELRSLDRPTRPVGTSVDGWVAFAGARIRLNQLGVVPDATDFDGKPFAVPNTRIWGALVTFDLTGTALDGCTVLMEDDAGRRFSDRPEELAKAHLTTGGGCSRPDAAPPGKPYALTFFFLAPRAARPAAVWITVPTANPSYARLPRPVS